MCQKLRRKNGTKAKKSDEFLAEVLSCKSQGTDEVGKRPLDASGAVPCAFVSAAALYGLIGCARSTNHRPKRLPSLVYLAIGAETLSEPGALALRAFGKELTVDGLAVKLGL